MLIDLHAHSSGISKCCRIPIEEVLLAARRVGIDGVVLTNHYQKNYVTGGDYAAFARRYVAEFHRAQACAEKLGARVFFGIEVTAERHPGVHLEIYGVEEQFILDYPEIFELTQEEMYRLVKSHGGYLIQAHPYRRGDRLLDVKYLDGIEINCHPLYESTHFAALKDIAHDAGILLTCGGDFHADTHRARCGVYLPDELRDTKEILQYLDASESVRLCVQEVDSMEWRDEVYVRNRRKEAYI